MKQHPLKNPVLQRVPQPVTDQVLADIECLIAKAPLNRPWFTSAYVHDLVVELKQLRARVCALEEAATSLALANVR